MDKREQTPAARNFQCCNLGSPFPTPFPAPDLIQVLPHHTLWSILGQSLLINYLQLSVLSWFNFPICLVAS